MLEDVGYNRGLGMVDAAKVQHFKSGTNLMRVLKLY